MPDIDDMWDDEEDAAMFSQGARDRVALGLARPSALAAAPQPAPERTLLAKIVQDAMIRTGVRWDSRSSDAIADALLTDFNITRKETGV